MDLEGQTVTKSADLSLLTHTKQLLLVTFFDMSAGMGSMTGRKDGVWMDRHER